MDQFKNPIFDEEYLVVKNEIYVYLNKHPEYWKNQGYLIKKSCISNKGKSSFKYDVSEKAYEMLSEVFKRKIKKRLFISSLKEKANSLIAKNMNVNLLNLMEA